MAKQMLLYESVVPISAGRHENWSIEKGKDYTYAAGI